MTALEIALLILCGLFAGGLLGAVWELRRLHRVCMRSWMAQGAAQDQANRLQQELAEAHKRIGAIQATRGEVLEAAIGAVKLAQLDALRPREMPPRNPLKPDAENHADIPTAGR